MNLHMRFRLAARLMTLDDLELLHVWIFPEFRVISQIWEATTAKRMTIELLSAMHRLRWYIGGPSSARGSTVTIPWVKMVIFNLYARKYCNLQTVSNAAPVTINHQLEICCRFLHYGSSYTHCCRALTLAWARLSCYLTARMSVWAKWAVFCKLCSKCPPFALTHAVSRHHHWSIQCQ